MRRGTAPSVALAGPTAQAVPKADNSQSFDQVTRVSPMIAV